MTVRCTKCGEPLLGAVNRCWKCGQAFAVHAEADGQPPLLSAAATVGEDQPLDAIVLEDGAVSPYSIPNTYSKPAPVLTTGDRIDIRRKQAMATGGTVGSFVLACFALAIAGFRVEGAFIAAIGLIMGIWGLYSRHRRWALAAMLLCWLGIALGGYTGVRQLYIYIQKNQPTNQGAPSP